MGSKKKIGLATKIKVELRLLKKLNSNIDTMIAAKERSIKRKQYLESLAGDYSQDIAELDRIISSFDIEKSISYATALESKYIASIHKIADDIDRKMVIDTFVNGKTYAAIGREVGYSESSVQKHINAAIAVIAEQMEEE